MEILLLLGLAAVCIPGGMFINQRLSSRRMLPKPGHRQFYSDGLMTQEIEALKLESSQPTDEH